MMQNISLKTRFIRDYQLFLKLSGIDFQWFNCIYERGKDLLYTYLIVILGTRDAASCNPTPTRKDGTLPEGCVIHGTANNIVDVGECEPIPCLRNDSALSNKNCEDEKFCCSVEKVTDVPVSCGGSVTFSLSKVARCGCQKCEEPKSQISGIVVGLNGAIEKPIAYCDIEFEGNFYSADDNGFFTFEAPKDKQRLSVVFKDSYDEEYADFTKVFHIVKGQTLFSKIILKTKPVPKPFNSSEDFKVQLGESNGDSAFAEMEIPKDAMLKDDGTIFSGQANLRLDVMDPRNMSDILTAPGDFSTVDEDGEEQMLLSYGMLSLDFEDDSGNKLSTSKPIKLNLDPQKFNISVDSHGNTKAKLWWLDAKTGRWIEAGDLRLENKTSGRRKRSPTRFVLETEITPAISRRGKLNIDVIADFGAVRVTAPVGSTIRTLCEEPNTVPKKYTGYLESTVNDLQVACISVWIKKTCFMQGESDDARFLEPLRPDSFPSSVSATIVTNQKLQGSSIVQSFKFEVNTASAGPIFPHTDRDAPQQCKAPVLTSGLRQFKFQDPAPTPLNLLSSRVRDRKDPRNWYSTNENCFIKILIHGRNSSIFLASSHRPNKGNKFGDSATMAQPATDRDDAYVACLEIRCPGDVYNTDTGRQVPEWTHVLVTHLTGNCDFQKHHLCKQNDIDNQGTACPTRSKRHSPGSETWLCVPLPQSGFDIDHVYTASRNKLRLGEKKCQNGNKRWALGMDDKINVQGPSVEFSCR